MKREELTVPLSELKPNPDNPRTIKKQKLNQLKKSLAEFPEMMQLRPIVVDENNVILGGNMRYEALKANGAVNTQVVKVTGLTDAQKREFVIKDNVPFGDWDWDKLANEWDAEELNDWGLDVPTDETEHYADLLDVELPIYEPSATPPEISDCAELDEADELLEKIDKAECSEELKRIMRHRASFFVKFDWQKIADLYHSENDRTKELMRDLGMVVIMPKEAYHRGIVQFRKDFNEWLDA